MLPNGWTEFVALLAAFLISALTMPAGISGAVLLLPFQVSVLGTPGSSVTPTNLLYNVVSTPGALYRGLAVVVGCVGGIYGLGGGAFLAPVLIGSGRKPSEVAPATLASTLVTSLAGVITFVILSLHTPGAVAPDFDHGIALGIGGLVGGYTGARLQSRMPDHGRSGRADDGGRGEGSRHGLCSGASSASRVRNSCGQLPLRPVTLTFRSQGLRASGLVHRPFARVRRACHACSST